MAKMLGESGAYREVLAALGEVKLSITSLDELPTLQADITEFLKSAEANATAEYETETANLQALLKQAEVQMQASLAESGAEYVRTREVIEAKVERLRGEWDKLGSFFENILPPDRLVDWIKAFWHTRQARIELDALDDARNRVCRTMVKPVRKLEQQLETHASSKGSFIKLRIKNIQAQLACVTRLLEEGEVGGAAAELEVIAKLQQLPDEWTVLNDVNLVADRWYFFEKEHLKTAQLDHVVVGPGGVFVIETKNWSREFVEAGEYHNPYKQIARASFLCHKRLTEAGAYSKTRSIIATRTRLPEKPKGSYAWILKPEKLTRHLLGSKAELTPTEIERIVSILSPQINKVLHGK